MTSIKDLELRIKSAESTVEMLRGELEELRQQQQPEPEQESLLGRWATHPKHGRGIIASDKPDTFKEVRFTIRNDEFTDGADQSFIRVDDLTLGPLTLNTVKDFKDAPDGTIIEIMVEPKDVYVKKDNAWYGAGENYATSSQALAKARVIRWGNGQ